MTTPLVQLRRIRKEFPGVVALDDVDFDLNTGEIHALAGENGSGKSTLAKVLYGAHLPDRGTIALDGKRLRFTSPREALDHGIVAISQELTLAPTLTVAENILMRHLPRRGGLVNWPAAHRLARAALDDLGVEVDTHRRLATLSLELQQEVEVARAFSIDARVLVLDEATSSLSDAATDRLLDRLARLRDRDVAIVFISHRLRELYRCATRVTVLRDGRLVATTSLPETGEGELVRMMVGREITDLFSKRPIELGPPALSASGLTTLDGTVERATLEVRRGEIVGVAGLEGCGKRELGLALAGVIPSTGTVRAGGDPVRVDSPRRALEAGIGFVPDDRKRSALLPTRSLLHNLAVAWLGRLSRFGVIRVGQEREMAQRSLRRLTIRAPSLRTPIVDLSGGNQQKVVLGRLLETPLKAMILSEPTRGIDVGAKEDVYKLIQGLADAGTGVIVISSEIPELLGLCDRILVMHRGGICAEFDGANASENEIAHAAFGASAADAP